ncbi:MAG: right-handed parallel beta-helix repeat-containing protein, partial [Planctomycetes bacterium]|nr:right-handed parallel beta-helix repeat-containing protein [Planctomycetota bacterium]
MRVFLTLVIFLLISVPTFGKIIYVDGNNQTGPYLGTFEDPYRYIDHGTEGIGALAWALNGDTILVRPNTYVETLDFRGKAVTVRSDIDFDVATFDFDAYGTVVDGNQSGSVVTFDSGESEDSVLWGFTLTNGSGTYKAPYTFGGGIYIQSASPKIKYCIIRDNTDVDMGGGIYCYYLANPIILNCAIAYNSATGYDYGHGGGMACKFMCNPIIVNCTFTKNTAQREGGGLWAYHRCNVETYNTIFSAHTATDGREIYIGTPYYPSDLKIRNCVIQGDQKYIAPNCSVDDNNGSEIATDNPRLRAPENLDYRLTTASLDPCINKGDNSAPYVDELITDLDGDTYNGARMIEGITSKTKGNMNGFFDIDI